MINFIGTGNPIGFMVRISRFSAFLASSSFFLLFLYISFISFGLFYFMHLTHVSIRPPGIVLVGMVMVIIYIFLYFFITFSSTVRLLCSYVKLYIWTFLFSSTMQRNMVP